MSVWYLRRTKYLGWFDDNTGFPSNVNSNIGSRISSKQNSANRATGVRNICCLTWCALVHTCQYMPAKYLHYSICEIKSAYRIRSLLGLRRSENTPASAKFWSHARESLWWKCIRINTLNIILKVKWRRSAPSCNRRRRGMRWGARGTAIWASAIIIFVILISSPQ